MNGKCGVLGRWTVAWAVLLAWAVPQVCRAAEPARKPLEYRFIFVPNDRPQDWPKRNVTYLPVAREEFDELVKAANAQPPLVDHGVAPVARAHYLATFQEPDLLVGEARLELLHGGQKTALVTLDPFDLSITTAAWADGSEATVGALQPDGKLAVLVERPGTLVCNWSMRGRRDVGGTIVFPLDLPAATIGQLELRVPDSLTPVVDNGVELGRSEEHHVGHWRFQLPARPRARLRLQGSDSRVRYRGLALLQEKTAYSLLPGGIDLEAQFKLDVCREPLRRLEIDIDAPLRVVSVQHAGTEVPWSIERDTATKERHLRVDFAAPLLGPGQVVTVTALAPLAIGAPVNLPRLRVREVAWQEGDLSLLAPAPLVLDALVPQDCRQTKTSQLTGGPSGESVELQMFSPDASVMMELSRRPARGRLVSGTTLRFASDSMRAEFRGRIEAIEGESFALAADVAEGWEIDSVTADRVGALASWTVNRSARPSILVLQLAEPVSVNRPLELMITGHRRATAEARLSGQILEMLHFRNLTEARRLLVLETAVSESVRLEGVDRPRMRQRSSLSAADRALLPSSFSHAILEVDSGRTDWGVVLERRTPRYSVHIRSLAQIAKRDVTESYRFQCRPDGARMDRLIVSLTQARPELPVFNGDQSLGTVAAERLSAEAQAARGVPPDGEAWLLRWSRPAAEPFELRATRTTAVTDRFVPALAASPDAAEQQGVVEVRFREAPLAIEAADRLEPLPPLPADGEGPTGGARFRYTPVAELGGAAPPALVLHPTADGVQPARAYAWRLRLHSFFRASGESDHVAVFDVENRGATQCVINLPQGAELIAARVGGQAISKRIAGLDVKIDLPQGEAYPVILVEYRFRATPMGPLARCEAPWPTIDWPVAMRQWKVSSASQYDPLSWSDGPPGWPRRLFGPLARRVGEPPWNPASLADWRMAVSRWRGESDSVAPASLLLQTLGRSLVATEEADLPLRRLFTGDLEARSGPLARVVVDVRALAAINIDPAAPILSYSAAGDLDDEASGALAAQRLSALGLALLVDGDQFVLTSRTAAMGSGDDAFGGAIFIRRPSFADRASQDATSSTPYVPLAAWLQSPDAAWQVAMENCDRDLILGGNSYEIAPNGAGAWYVLLVRQDVAIAASWALGAFVFWLGTSFFAGRFVWLVPAVGFAALAATWAPAALLPLTWAVLFGSAASAAWRRIRPRAHGSSAATKPPEKLARAAGFAATPLAFLVLAAALAEADDDRETIESPAPVHQVFVPVDSANKSGTRPYQVPTDFLDELRRRASLAGNEPRGWFITSAKYDCQLARESLETTISVTAFTARFKLEALSPNVRVRLPFRQRQSELARDGARLDGQPIRMVWSEAGDELVCDLIEPGLYELEISLLPVISDAPESRELKLSIPKVAMATLDVALPAEGLIVELPGVLGEKRLIEGGRKLSAGLGDIDTLVLRWPPPPAAAPLAEVEELLWLKVRPGSVVLDVALKLKVTGGALRALEFAADRRLRLVPGALTARELPALNEPALLGAPVTTELELERPLTGQDTLRLSFFVTGASGVGNIRLPSFHTVNARVARRWLAVTVASGLEYETRDAQQLEALPVAEFAAQWGGADAALSDALAYRLPTDDTNWTLTTQSRQPQTTAKETLSLSFQPRHALVHYEADLMTSEGYVFQHRLLVPPEIEVENISLEADGFDRVSHWARTDQGVVSVFLGRRFTGAQRLTLSGRLPVRAGGRVSLPKVTMDVGSPAVTVEHVEILSRIVRLYRQSAVRITLEEAEGLFPLAGPAPEPFDNRLGRHVISQAAEGNCSAIVAVAANECQVHDLEQLTVLRFANQQWQAEISFRFTVENGVLDLMRLDLPLAWSAGVEVVAPAALTEVSQQPDDNRHEMVVRPLVPFSGQCQLKLRLVAKFPPGENVTAPDVAAADLPSRERYWLLPRQVGIETVIWEPERMSPATLPERFKDVPAEASLVFRALGERPRAVMSAVKASAELARVRLIDVRLALSGNSLSGVAAFDLLPGGRVSCPFELAADWHLLEVSVGGLPVVPVAKGPGKWEVPLRSNHLPQRLEAAFLRDDISAALRMSWPVVWLADWPVEESLLTIVAPDDHSVHVGIPPASREIVKSARLASVIELLELPAESVATTDREELAAWYEPWAHWLICCGRAEHRSVADLATPSGKAELVDEIWAKNARRLGVDQVLGRLTHQPLRATQLTEVWQQLHGPDPAKHYHWTGPPAATEIRLLRNWSGWFHRLTGSLWIGVFVVAALALRRLAPGSFVDRWPHVLLVGAGLGWWLFCQPSAAGWLWTAAGLALALRSLWRPLSTASSRTFP